MTTCLENWNVQLRNLLSNILSGLMENGLTLGSKDKYIKYAITILKLTAFTVFAIVLIRYKQKQSESKQNFSRFYFAILSQSVEVRQIYNLH